MFGTCTFGVNNLGDLHFLIVPIPFICIMNADQYIFLFSCIMFSKFSIVQLMVLLPLINTVIGSQDVSVADERSTAHACCPCSAPWAAWQITQPNHPWVPVCISNLAAADPISSIFVFLA